MSPFSRWTTGALVRVALPAAAAFLVAVGPVTPAGAAAGDLYARGIEWCAGTYPGHGTLDGFGPPLDLNGKGGVNDEGWPVYAPEDGSVRIVNTVDDGNGWGNAIIWRSADRTEKIHMAHLKSFGETGIVSAGEVIGRVGQTGYATGPHLHVAARRDGEPAQVELHGEIIRAGRCYVSRGPIPPGCAGRTATIVGDRGDDVLVGTPEADVIVGLGGDDEIEGRGGPDVICAGRGRDDVSAQEGEDRLRGNDGGDTLVGGGGADLLKGHDGSDLLVGKAGPDKVQGFAGNDLLQGTEGNDLLAGGLGRDTASLMSATTGVTVRIDEGTASGEGTDTLLEVESARGSDYADRLIGDAGRNRLAGARGDDVLRGKGGDDTLNGGVGDDTCMGGEEVIACEP